jgi:hypothetical protein
VIKGWADYHRHVVSKRVVARVDSEIWRALWQWCCRRHPNKGRRWIKHRYFRCIGTRDWIFAAQTGEYWPDGKPIVTTLRYAAEVPIRRYIKIQAEANPFDPAWEGSSPAESSITECLTYFAANAGFVRERIGEGVRLTREMERIGVRLSDRTGDRSHLGSPAHAAAGSLIRSLPFSKRPAKRRKNADCTSTVTLKSYQLPLSTTDQFVSAALPAFTWKVHGPSLRYAFDVTVNVQGPLPLFTNDRWTALFVTS